MGKNIERMAERTGRSLKENNQYVNFADYLDGALNDFGEIRTALRFPQLTLNAGLPLSTRRDYLLNSANDGGVEFLDGEYRVFATSTAGSVGSLITRQRANYLSGSVLEVGLGLRIPTAPTGDAEINWGFIDFDRTTAVQFNYTSSGVRLQVYNNGSLEVDVPQSEWNIDKLDGNGASGATFDPATGYVYQVPIIYYGYGDIRFQVMVVTNGRKRVVDIHRESQNGQINITNSNLPLGIEVFSDGTLLEAFVGGRQINSSFPDVVRPRLTSGRRLLQTVGSTFVPLISFRHKEAFKKIFCSLDSIEVDTTGDLILEVRRNPTLTGADFAYLGNYAESERALQYDVVATAITGGETVFDELASGGLGNSSNLRSIDVNDRYINEFETYSLCARTLTGTATVTSLFRNLERW